MTKTKPTKKGENQGRPAIKQVLPPEKGKRSTDDLFVLLFTRLARCEMRFAHVREANISHLQSKYFIAKRFHLPEWANFVAHLLYRRCAVRLSFFTFLSQPCVAGSHRVRIPLTVYCVIRRVRPTNSKFHPPKVDFTRRRRISLRKSRSALRYTLSLRYAAVRQRYDSAAGTSSSGILSVK